MALVRKVGGGLVETQLEGSGSSTAPTPTSPAATAATGASPSVAKMHVGYIYKVTCTISNKSYIGQTIKDPSKRWSEHIKRARVESAKSRDYPILKALRKYGGKSWVLTVLEEVPIENLDLREIALIAEHNTISPFGYNLQPGGRTPREIHCETRNKIRDKLLGRVFSSETIQRMRDAAKLRRKMYEESYRLADKVRGRSREIRVIARYPDFVIEFKSIKDAADHFWLSPNVISACLRGKQHTAGGVVWTYG